MGMRAKAHNKRGKKTHQFGGKENGTGTKVRNDKREKQRASKKHTISISFFFHCKNSIQKKL